MSLPNTEAPIEDLKGDEVVVTSPTSAEIAEIAVVAQTSTEITAVAEITEVVVVFPKAVFTGVHYWSRFVAFTHKTSMLSAAVENREYDEHIRTFVPEEVTARVQELIDEQHAATCQKRPRENPVLDLFASILIVNQGLREVRKLLEHDRNTEVENENDEDKVVLYESRMLAIEEGESFDTGWVSASEAVTKFVEGEVDAEAAVEALNEIILDEPDDELD